MQQQNIISPNQTSEAALVLCNNDFITNLNHKYRNKNKATNVLSFPYFSQNELKTNRETEIYLGDIIISLEKIIEEAKLYNKDNTAHFIHLLIHGILHLLGYDHIQETEKTMEKLEILILDKLGYNNPYQ